VAPQTQVIVVSAPQLGRDPMNVYCPNCKVTVLSRVQLVTNWLCCYLLFFFGGPIALFLLCYDGIKDIEHYCPQCQSMLGRASGWQLLNGNKKALVIITVVFIGIAIYAIAVALRIAARSG